MPRMKYTEKKPAVETISSKELASNIKLNMTEDRNSTYLIQCSKYPAKYYFSKIFNEAVRKTISVL